MTNRSFIKQLFQKLFSIILLASIFSGAFSVSAQTRRVMPSGKTAAPNAAVKTANNSEPLTGWKGSITYTRKLTDEFSSDEPVLGRVDQQRNRIKHHNSRKVLYEGSLIVDGGNAAQLLTKANVSFSDEDLQKGTQIVVDSCHAFNDDHEFVDESRDEMVYKAIGKGAGDGFNISANFDESPNYHFSFRFPDAIGTYTREQHVTHKGYCQPKNNEPVDLSQSEATKIEGESVSIDDRFDPKSPDTISGTKTWGGAKSGGVATFAYRVSWHLTRKPQKLLITDLLFEHPQFPDYDNWQEIVSEIGTVDGNLVKIKAKVLNLSDETKYAEIYFKESYKGDQYNGANPELPIATAVSVRLDPGEEREVEGLWNTEGYAWFDDGRPRLVQRVKAEAWEENKKKDEQIKNVKVAPKPIIFVPGVWTKAQDFEIYQNLLTFTHSFDWKTYRVIDTTGQGTIGGEGVIKQTKVNRSVYDNSDNLMTYVTNIRAASNAWHVDMLAHSTGGLVARLYIHKQMEIVPDNKPVVKHLLMLGVPNNGVPCADSLRNIDAFRNNLQTAKELLPEEIALFNQYVTNRKGTRFSALVGSSFPILCASPAWNDGFVSVESAKYGITDFAVTKASQPDLISTKTFDDFIKPHIVTGPRGTYPLPVISEEGGNDGRNQ